MQIRYLLALIFDGESSWSETDFKDVCLIIFYSHTCSQINPNENLPQQICDLCIVQLNVSYNFKRLALKNDFHIRQYMIENGMSLRKNDEDNTETTTALEIHQTYHNIIRTNRFRQLSAPEIRRNSTTSSSGTSTMLVTGRESNLTPNNSATDNFVSPRPIVRPIQIKTEPVDPDDEVKEASPVTSSPSNASEPTSVVTISSTAQSVKQPMVVIHAIINNDSFSDQTKTVEKPRAETRPNVKPALGRSHKDTPKDTSHNLRTIKKPDAAQNKKLRKAIEKTVQQERHSSRISTKKEAKANLKKANFRVVSKDRAKEVAKPRGRPRKTPIVNKHANNKKKQTGNKKSWDSVLVTRLQTFINIRTRHRKLAIINRNRPYYKW